MASWYRTLDAGLWGNAPFRNLSRPQPNAQFLWIYLLTGEHTQGMPGLYNIGVAALAEAIGWSPDATRAVLTELESQGMARVDAEARVIYLLDALDHQPPKNPKHLMGWNKEWRRIPDCELKSAWLQALLGFARARGESWVTAVIEGFDTVCDTSAARAGDTVSDTVSGTVSPPHTPTHTLTPTQSQLRPAAGLRREPAVEAKALAEELAACMRRNDPAARIPANLRGWASDIDALHRLDARSWEQIGQVIRWSQADPFWRSNILSAAKLRKQFPQLALKMATPGSTHGARPAESPPNLLPPPPPRPVWTDEPEVQP